MTVEKHPFHREDFERNLARDPISPTANSRRIAVVDAFPLARAGTSAVLGAAAHHVVDADCLDDLPRIDDIDICVVSLRDRLEWEALERSKVAEAVPVVAIVAEADVSAIGTAISRGATAVLPANARPDELLSAVDAAAGGHAFFPQACLRSWMTARENRPELSDVEYEWLSALAHGATVRELSERFSYSERQVHRRLSSLYRRLGVSCRAEAISRAERTGMLEG